MGVSGGRGDKGPGAGGVEARYEKRPEGRGCRHRWVWRREREERERGEKSPHLFVRLPLRCNNSSGGDLIARKWESVESRLGSCAQRFRLPVLSTPFILLIFFPFSPSSKFKTYNTKDF